MMNTNLQLYTPPKSLLSVPCHRRTETILFRAELAAGHLPDSLLLWCKMRELRRRKPSLARYLREARRAGFVVVAAAIEDSKITLTFADGSQTSTSSDNPWDEATAKLEKATKQ
jgi:hypothetical protein